MVVCGRRTPLRSLAAAAGAFCLADVADAFGFTLQLRRRLRPFQRPLKSHRSDGSPDEERLDVDAGGGRRDFLARAAAAAPVLLGPSPRAEAAAASASASAPSDDATRIELAVDTEYLVRVLNYFDGDMRRALGALVRSPQTTVEIVPPARAGGLEGGLSPRDAILRALYSYGSPDDYVPQASWLKVDEAGGEWIEFLMKKRYRVYLPSLGGEGIGGEGEGGLEVTLRPTNINLSNLQAAVGLAVLSYPLAYGYYNYESYREEEEKKAKKAQMAAKRAAKAKAAVAGKGTKSTSKEAKALAGKGGDKKKGPPAIKGQERKETEISDRPTPNKKGSTAAPTIEDKVAAEMLDLQRENFIAATGGNSAESPTGENDNELGGLIAAAHADSREDMVSPQDAPFLDETSDEGIRSEEEMSQSRSGENYVKPKAGPFNSYLDSL